MDVLILVVLLIIGFLSGTVSGLLGVGGGLVAVPTLVLLRILSYRDAVAASLLFIVLVAPVALWRHGKAKNVDVRTALLLGASGFSGVLLGTVIGPRLSDQALLVAFGAALLVTAQNLAYGRMPDRRRQAPLLPIAAGVLAGLVAKLFGIGGGIILVPAMVFTGIEIHLAIGTSLAAVATNGLLSSAVNLLHDRAWVPFVPALAAGGLGGAFLGAKLSLRSRAQTLRSLFALVLSLVALALLRRAFEA